MAEFQISELSHGHPYDYPSFYAERGLGMVKFKTEYCQPEISRLKELVSRHRKIAAQQEKKLKSVPKSWMLSKREAISMIGSTLHYTDESGEVYETLKQCSYDGERIFGTKHCAADIHHPEALMQ